MARFGTLGTQYFDDDGDPLVEGKIYFYESGTTTDKATYADVDLTIPNEQPVLLSGSGRQPNIFFNGTARAILTNSDDEQKDFVDPVGDTSASYGSAWDATKSYAISDVVLGTDGNYYQSLTASNLGNTPSTSPTEWKLTSPQTASDLGFVPSGDIVATNVQAAIEEVDSEKQATLVSGTNIKTVNGETLLGAGDLLTPPAGLVKQDSGTFSAAATVLISLPATYKRYRIMFHGLTSSVSSNLKYRMRVNSTIQTTAVYQTRTSTLGAVYAGIAVSGDSEFDSALGTTANIASLYVIDIEVGGQPANSPVGEWTAQWVSGLNSDMGVDGGRLAVNDDIDGIQIYSAAGTLSGAYHVYGYED